MKKTKTAAMLLGLALALTACKPSSSQEDPAKITESSAAAEGLEQSGTEESTVFASPSQVQGSASETAENAADGENAVEITVDIFSEESADGAVSLMGEYRGAVLKGSAYAAVSGSLQSWMEERRKNFDGEYAELKKRLEDISATEGFYGYSCYAWLKTARADERIISLLAGNGYYGEETVCSYDSRTWDVQSGKELTLADLGKDGSDLASALRETYGVQTGEDFWEAPVWYLDGAGIELVYGTQDYLAENQLTVPYGEIRDMLREEYLPFEKPGITVLGENQRAGIPISGSDVPAEVWVEVVTDEETYESKVTLHVGEEQLDCSEYVSVLDSYLVKKDNGKLFLLQTSNYGSDDYVLTVYDVTEGKMQSVGEPVAGICVDDTWMSADHIRMQKSVDLFGTYTALADYALDDDGVLTDTTEIYPIRVYSSFQLLTVKKELPVTVGGEKRGLEPGTVIRITATNNRDTMYFTIPETGEEGEFTFTSEGEDSWNKYVDGVKDEDYFEMLPFAG